MTYRTVARALMVPLLLGVLCLSFGAASPRASGAGDASLQGDADCSGTVNTADSVAILGWDAGIAAPPCEYLADVQCDGNVDAFDALSLLRWKSGIGAVPEPGCTEIGQAVEVEKGSPAVVTLTGASETGFNPVSAAIGFEVTGAELSADPGDVAVIVNDERLADNAVHVAGGIVTPDVTLTEGPTHILLLATDTNGLPIFWEGTLWAGGETAIVSLDDESGGANNGAEVTARLLDNPAVSETVMSAGGQAAFHNLPPLPIIVTVFSGDELTSQTVLEPNAASVSGSAEPAAFGPGALTLRDRVVSISRLELNDIDNTPLEFLSADDHTYFGGNTRINGKITIIGDPCDALQSLKLQILEGGAVVAEADLTQAAQNRLLKQFPANRKLEIAASQLLFELPSGEAAKLSDFDGRVVLRVRAKTLFGYEAEYVYGSVEKLFRYKDGNRYGGRDGGVGGDDWVKASVKEVVGGYPGNTWGDFSNMNGGQFDPHKGHRTGNEIDGIFPGYLALNAATAATMIDQLNGARDGSRITTVYVTYSRTVGDPFWNAIKNVTLNDGRPARDVIRPAPNHGTHFHWIVSSPASAPAVAPGDPLNPPPNYNPSTGGCVGWIGTTHFTETRASLGAVRIVDVHANVLFEYHDPLKDHIFYDCEADPFPCSLYIPKGTINWTYSMEHHLEDFDCSEHQAGSIPAGNVIIRSDQELVLKSDFAGGYFYSGDAFDPTVEIELACTVYGGHYDPTRYFEAPESEHFRVSQDGQSISGSYSYSVFEEGGTHVFTFDWDLHRAGQTPP